MFKLDITSSPFFFAKTFWSFFSCCIKISDNSIYESIFSDIMTKLT